MGRNLEFQTYDDRLNKIRKMAYTECSNFIQIFKRYIDDLKKIGEASKALLRKQQREAVKEKAIEMGVANPNGKDIKQYIAANGIPFEHKFIQTEVDLALLNEFVDTLYETLTALKTQRKIVMKSDLFVIKETCKNMDKTFIKQYSPLPEMMSMFEDCQKVDPAVFEKGIWGMMEASADSNLLNEKEMEELFMEKKQVELQEAQKLEAMKQEMKAKELEVTSEETEDVYPNGEFKKIRTADEEKKIEEFTFALEDIRDIKKDMEKMYSESARKHKDDFLKAFDGLDKFINLKAFIKRGAVIIREDVCIKKALAYTDKLYNLISQVKKNCIVCPHTYHVIEAE